MNFVYLGTRIEGTWVMTELKINGMDSTSLLTVDSLKIFTKYVFGPLGGGSKGSITRMETYNHSDTLDFYLEYNFIGLPI